MAGQASRGTVSRREIASERRGAALRDRLAVLRDDRARPSMAWVGRVPRVGRHGPPVPLDQLNPRAFRSRIPARDLAEADAADEALLNWEIWTSVRPGARLPIPKHAGLLPVPAIDR